LQRLYKLYHMKPDPQVVAMWSQHLYDLTPQGIEWACLELERHFKPTLACPFPTPAHVRELLEKPAHLLAEQAAEEAWQRVVLAVNKGLWDPDHGYRDPKDKLPEEFKPHIAAAGGLSYLYHAEPKEQLWAKKEFLKSWMRDFEIHRYQRTVQP
jgi:hypothetical protein